MKENILYLGDTSLESAAAYLAGVIHRSGWAFDYLPSDVPCSESLLREPRSLVILSDYPRKALDVSLQKRLALMVEKGTGLLMIGGWESFHGLGGDWDGSPVADLLPVEISTEDDRVNCDHVALVRPAEDHSILEGLPWNERPPVIGGFNRFTPREGAVKILEVRRLRPRPSGEGYDLVPEGTDPLLVVGRHGRGRTAALATDAAPHWVGPLVDWGSERLTARAPGAGEVEVGELYARFFSQLIAWTAGDDKGLQDNQGNGGTE